MSMPVKRKDDMKLPAHLEHAIERLIDVRGRKTADGRRIAGERTQMARPYVIKFCFAELYQLGFKLPAPDSLREVHVKALVDHWIATGKSASTIQNKLTHLRQFAKWIGKPGLVRHTEYYVDEANLHRVRRQTVATESRAWDAKGIDPVAVIKRAEEIDRWTALYLRLMYAFGLRLKEAIHLRPVVDVTSTGQFLSVRDGTKGGRHRMVPIETDYQRETLVLAQAMAQPKNKRIIPAHCTLDQTYQRTRYRMRKIGLTREGLGVTAHGLRHQYAQNCYEALAGQPSPIQGGDPKQIDRDTHMHVCHDVMQRMGHYRVDVGGAYLGSPGHKLRGTSSLFRPWERRIGKFDYGVKNSCTAKAVYLFVPKLSANGEATPNATVTDVEEKEGEQS